MFVIIYLDKTYYYKCQSFSIDTEKCEYIVDDVITAIDKKYICNLKFTAFGESIDEHVSIYRKHKRSDRCSKIDECIDNGFKLIEMYGSSSHFTNGEQSFSNFSFNDQQLGSGNIIVTLKTLN